MTRKDASDRAHESRHKVQEPRIQVTTNKSQTEKSQQSRYTTQNEYAKDIDVTQQKGKEPEAGRWG